MSGFPRPVDAELTAPLELPAVPGKPLTTQGGNTLDDGSGNVTLYQGNLELANSFGHFYVDGWGTQGQTIDIVIGTSFTIGTAAHPIPLTLNGNFTASGHVNATPTTPALPTNPPVSGTVYQNTTGGPIIITVPITATAVGGSGQWALGSTSTPSDWGGAEQIGVSGEVHNMTLYVPNDWYWSLTVASATIGTASVLGL